MPRSHFALFKNIEYNPYAYIDRAVFKLLSLYKLSPHIRRQVKTNLDFSKPDNYNKYIAISSKLYILFDRVVPGFYFPDSLGFGAGNIVTPHYSLSIFRDFSGPEFNFHITSKNLELYPWLSSCNQDPIPTSYPFLNILVPRVGFIGSLKKQDQLNPVLSPRYPCKEGNRELKTNDIFKFVASDIVRSIHYLEQ